MTERGQPPAGPAPARDRLAHRVRRARERGRRHLGVRGALPASLRASERALGEVREFAPVLRSVARVAARADPQAARDQRGGDRRSCARPSRCCATRSGRSCAPRGPWTDDLRLAARDTAKATPDLKTLVRRAQPLLQHRRVQPGRGRGARRQVDLPAARSARRASSTGSPGPSQNGASLFSTADGQGPWRRVTICGVPAAGPHGRSSSGVLADVGSSTTPSSPTSSPTPGRRRQQRRRPAAGDRSSAPATSTRCRRRRLRAAAAASRSCRFPRSRRSCHEQEPTQPRTHRRHGRVHPVRGRAPDVPLDRVRRHAAAAPGGLPLQGGLPRGLAARAGGRRADGRA